MKHSSTKPGKKILEVPCPICRTPTPWEGNPLRPFCSERCKNKDLAAWADGGYAIPTEDSPSSEGGDS
ncbi:MAG: DNA gyrase inhibitor YacG [Deltaproteobacteria bacterium]|nr:DNA gyrase inhibitor YacG [Deltaproteobacteria bacterium]